MYNVMIRIPLLAFVGVSLCKTNAHAESSASDLDQSTAEISGTEAEVVWPLAMRDRPLTLGRGMLSAGASVDMASSFDDIRLGLGGLSGLSYGISDSFTLGVSYSLGVTPSEGRGPVGVHAGYTVYAKGNLILTATGSAARDLLTESNAAGLGLLYWYNLGDRFSLFGGGDQLGVLLDPTAVGVSLPAALGYQVNAHTFLSLGTSFAELNLVDESEMLEDSLFGRDTLPFAFTTTYSPTNSLDLSLGMSSDLRDAPYDALAFGVSAIYYAGAN
jgi:hypothetical protein